MSLLPGWRIPRYWPFNFNIARYWPGFKPIPIPRGGGQKKKKFRFDIIKDDNEVILLVAQAFTRIMQ